MKQLTVALLLVTIAASHPEPDPQFRNFFGRLGPSLASRMGAIRTGTGAFMGRVGTLAKSHGPGALDMLGTSVDIGHRIFDITDRTRMWNLMKQYQNPSLSSTQMYQPYPNIYSNPSNLSPNSTVNGTQNPFQGYPYPPYPYPSPYVPYYPPYGQYPSPYSPYPSPFPSPFPSPYFPGYGLPPNSTDIVSVYTTTKPTGN